MYDAIYPCNYRLSVGSGRVNENTIIMQSEENNTYFN